MLACAPGSRATSPPSRSARRPCAWSKTSSPSCDPKRTEYLAGRTLDRGEMLYDRIVPDEQRRLIKSEVAGRAVTDLARWFERQWTDSVDFKNELIDILDASKFGTKEYTPYQIYIKAL